MKRAGNIILFSFAALLGLLLSGCSPGSDVAAMSPESALQRLRDGNDAYIGNKKNNADISRLRREETAVYGQNPYAVIITCSDSRVPPEHIFSAGIGDLFVIRTAGNVVGDFELGSIEYGVLHLGAKVILVMGHTGCGAVSAAFGDGHAEGHIAGIVDDINPGIVNAADLTEAEDLNIAHSFSRILESDIIAGLAESGEVAVSQGKYDLSTGKVDFLN